MVTGSLPLLPGPRPPLFWLLWILLVTVLLSNTSWDEVSLVSRIFISHICTFVHLYSLYVWHPFYRPSISQHSFIYTAFYTTLLYNPSIVSFMKVWASTKQFFSTLFSLLSNCLWLNKTSLVNLTGRSWNIWQIWFSWTIGVYCSPSILWELN